MRRKGLGKGRGTGYYNLVPMDSYVHSMSAKGQKTSLLFSNLFGESKRYKKDNLFITKDRVSGNITVANKRGDYKKYVGFRDNDAINDFISKYPEEEYFINAKGVKNNYFDNFYNLSRIRKDEKNIAKIEMGLGSPQLGALAIRSVSAGLGLGFDAVGVAIPVVGIAVGSLFGIVYLEEKYFERKLLKEIKQTVSE